MIRILLVIAGSYLVGYLIGRHRCSHEWSLPSAYDLGEQRRRCKKCNREQWRSTLESTSRRWFDMTNRRKTDSGTGPIAKMVKAVDS